MVLRRPRAVTAAAVASAIFLSGLGGSTALAGGPGDTYTPGSPGGGDPYYPLYGNGGYDVQHYLLDVNYNPDTDRLVGRATITARATKNLNRFNFDFQGLEVRQILVDGAPATWTRQHDHELVITPADVIDKGDTFTTWVRYDGVPRTLSLLSSPSGFVHTNDGALVVGEPEVSATWYPVNDHPTDKAAYTFVVTVPEGLKAVANGQLIRRFHHADRTTFVWDAREPMAPYLATLNVGRFRLHSYTFHRIRIIDAVDPALDDETTEDPGDPTFGDIIDESFSHLPEILGFLARQFGSYPFSAGGGLVDSYHQLFFALENQTRSVYSKYFFFDTINGDFVIVHENAHQWFGDSVSIRKWKNIWLNEGFATYAEWLWSKHAGYETPREIFDAYYGGIDESDPWWDVVIGDPGIENLFHGAVYVRGAMTLHALRMEVGSADFFDIVRTWAESKAGGNGSTQQFIALAESISGEQLDDLFNEWLFKSGKPAMDAATVRRSELAALGPPPRAMASELWRYKR